MDVAQEGLSVKLHDDFYSGEDMFGQDFFLSVYTGQVFPPSLKLQVPLANIQTTNHTCLGVISQSFLTTMKWLQLILVLFLTHNSDSYTGAYSMH